MSETMADIVAEMRSIANEQERLCFYDLRNVATDTLRVIADRIEAVTKCNHPEPVTNRHGLNAAKMREALRAIRDEMFKDSGMGPCTKLHTIIDTLTQAALSAPPRNCDRFDNEEDAFNNWSTTIGKNYKFGQGGYGMAWAFTKWLFAEAKGDGQ